MLTEFFLVIPFLFIVVHDCLDVEKVINLFSSVSISWSIFLALMTHTKVGHGSIRGADGGE